MSTPKKGDRVHVAYDAIVVTVNDDGDMTVQPDDAITFESTHVDWCTVLVPPVKVGDVVTAQNIGKLPRDSVIAAARMPAWTRYHKGWSFAGENFYDDNEMQPERHVDLRVLRIGGTS